MVSEDPMSLRSSHQVVKEVAMLRLSSVILVLLMNGRSAIGISLQYDCAMSNFIDPMDLFDPFYDDDLQCTRVCLLSSSSLSLCVVMRFFYPTRT